MSPEDKQISRIVPGSRLVGSKYRPDIDGLRAVAVLGVVLYHSGTGTRLVPGGFVGVDVFFVISGFLIATILLRQMDDGTLSLKTFYERRIRRIMPALFVMLGATLGFGFFKLTPWDLASLAASTRYSLVSFSNIYFNRMGGDYFTNGVAGMPLLHTWSLGVEEQFYLCFPLILMLAMCRRWNRRQLLTLLGGLSALSLGLCLWRIRANASDCFYLIPYRAWELLVGVLLALQSPPLGKGCKSNCVGVLGLGLILGSMALYNKNTLFPGVAAIAPCLGAAMVIAAGENGNGWARRVLAWKPLVFIGLISYSVYLWHWPLLAFQNALGAWDSTYRLSEPSRLLLGLTSLPVGYFSWRFVEQPFRSERRKGPQVFVGWAVVSALFLTIVIFAQKTNGFEGRIPLEARRFLKVKNAKNPFGERAFNSSPPPSEAFVYGDLTKKPEVVLWGDSHANVIAYEMGKAAKDHGCSLRFYGWGGLPPLVGMLRSGGDGKKRQNYNNEVMHILESDTSIKGVVLLARWSWTLRGYTQAYGPAENGEQSGSLMVRSDGLPFDTDQEAELAYASYLRETVARLRAVGKTVFLFYPIPEIGYDVPQTLARESILGHDPRAFHVPAQGVFFERQDFVMKLFDSLSDGPDLVRLKPHELLIVEGHIRLMQDEKILYSDSNHLSLEGAHLLRPFFEDIFNRFPGPNKTMNLKAK